MTTVTGPPVASPDAGGESQAIWKVKKEGQVSTKSHSPEQIIHLLRQAEVKLAGGKKTGEV